MAIDQLFRSNTKIEGKTIMSKGSEKKQKAKMGCPIVSNPESESTSCMAQKGNLAWWPQIIASAVVGVIGILSTSVSGHIERRSTLASKNEQLVNQNVTLERQLHDLQHEKKLSDNNAQSQIERLKEANATKDRKINDLQRENSEQRILLEGKEIRIEQLRNEMATIGIKDQQSMQAVINGESPKPTNLVCVVVQKHPAHSPRKFDIHLTVADRTNSSAAVQAYATQDFSNAVKKAHMVYDRIGHTLESMVGKKVFVHQDFQPTMAPVFRIVAEESFARGDFANSVSQSWLAVCLEMPRPNPFTLALHSAALTRSSSYSIGYMTSAIHDSIMRQSDETREEYRKQVYSTLCNMGYLQITFPNRDLTGAGEIIDWQKILGIAQPFYYRKDGQGDLWSMRWEGFGRYSEYNYTKAFTEGLLALRKVSQ